MIDWWRVAAYTLWIVGVALLLTWFSYRSWARSAAAEAGATAAHANGFPLPLALGLALLGTGLVATVVLALLR